MSWHRLQGAGVGAAAGPASRLGVCLTSPAYLLAVVGVGAAPDPDCLVRQSGSRLLLLTRLQLQPSRRCLLWTGLRAPPLLLLLT